MKVVKRLPANVILTCARWTSVQSLMLPDNVIGKCAECGHAIQYRPHAPKKARKICMECIPDDVTEFGTTQRMIDDFKTWAKKQKQ
ncbi:hypothetical protein ACVJ5M_005680 [Bradyrhizobium sp. S3.7.6]